MLAHPIAALAQFGFLPLAIVLFGRLPRAQAGALVVIGGLLFLPDITLVSITDAVKIEKDRIIYLGALLGLVVHHRKVFSEVNPVATLFVVLIGMFFINFATWRVNLTPIINEGSIQPGLSFAWVLGQSIDDFFRFGLPFLIGKAVIRSVRDLKTVLYWLVALGVIYTVLIFIELIMAIPFRVFQLSHYIYGIDFRPQFRYGLTEPIVFLSMGHTLSTFMVMTVIAAAGLLKIDSAARIWSVRRFRLWNLSGLLATLKVGSAILGVGSLLLMWMFKAKRVVSWVFLFAIGICVYPVLQVNDLFPEDVLVDLVAGYNAERARSFNGRFDEEEFVLDRLHGSRFWVGWGHYARIPGASWAGYESGEVGLDAWWVIRLGMSGIFGVLAALLVCAVPVFRAKRVLKNVTTPEVNWIMVTAMLCIAVRMADLLLNGWWNSLPVFMAGALLGACSDLRWQEKEPEVSKASERQKKQIQLYAGAVRKHR